MNSCFAYINDLTISIQVDLDPPLNKKISKTLYNNQ